MSSLRHRHLHDHNDGAVGGELVLSSFGLDCSIATGDGCWRPVMAGGKNIYVTACGGDA